MQNNAFRKISIKLITANDLCISCGSCTQVCPHQNIHLIYNIKRWKWEAEIKSKDLCSRCDGKKNCLSVCPSFDVDYITLARSHENHMLGQIKNVYNGYSKNDRRRFHSSSGGFIRDMGQSLFDGREIDGIISIFHKYGLEYMPDIVTDVSYMPNSIYHNINYEKAVNLLKTYNGRYLIIGLPCQIASIKLLTNKNNFHFLREKIYATVSLICGYSFDRCNVAAFAYYNKFNVDNITYRENGRYRKTRLNNKEASLLFPVKSPKNFKEKLNNMVFFDHFLAQTGCLYCVDHIGYCADIVVGDAWQKRYSQDIIGTNLIISRSEKGEEIIKKINGFHFEKGSISEIVESQSTNYALGALGEGIKKFRFKNMYYYPERKRTNNPDDVLIYQLKAVDLLKIRLIKKMLLTRRYGLARSLYALLEFKKLSKYFLKNTIKKILT